MDVLHPAHDFVWKGGNIGDDDEQAEARPIADDAIAVEDSGDDGHASQENIDQESASELSSADG